MNLSNFEKFVDKKIIDRGYDYYIDGNILDDYDKKDNKYYFYVEGTDSYEVEVVLGKNNEIEYSYCDCPYDYGPVCKHEVAVYYNLSSILQDKKNIVDLKEKKNGLKDVLDSLSKEELIAIILDVTKKDKVTRDKIILNNFKGDYEDEIHQCKKFINSIVNKYCGGNKFIDYFNVFNFTTELQGVLDKIEKTKDNKLAMKISLILMKECINTYQYCDDSNGEIQEIYSDCLMLMKKIAIERDKNTEKDVFNMLLKEISNLIYDDYEEIKIDILKICFEFADNKQLRDILRLKINNLINSVPNEDSGYYKDELFKILLDISSEYDSKLESKKFIKQNLNIEDFREKYINELIKEKEYKEVLELAQEGEKIYKNQWGATSKWKKYKYIALKELCLREDQIQLAKDLLIEGDFFYYKELKKLFKNNKFEFYKDIKKELKKHSYSMYIKVINAENDLDEIMEFIEKNPLYIEEYAHKLINKFPEKILKIYEDYIKTQGEIVSDRKGYRRVCEMISRYKKVAGKEKTIDLIGDFKICYGRKPAFIDELSKII